MHGHELAIDVNVNNMTSSMADGMCTSLFSQKYAGACGMLISE